MLEREHGSSITPERKHEALEKVKIHNDWFLKHVIKDEDQEGSTLIIIPRYHDDHRDEYLRYLVSEVSCLQNLN